MAIKINLMPRKDSDSAQETQKRPFYFMVAVIFFIICFLVYAGIYSYNTFVLKKQLEDVEKQNAEIQSNISRIATLKDLNALSAAILKGKNIRTLLSGHYYSTKIYELLENLTLKNVNYTKFSEKVSNDGTISITVFGEADNFNALAKQLLIYKKSKEIKQVIFDRAIVAKNAKISFSMTLIIDSKFIITRPIITLSGPSSLILDKGSAYSELGASAIDGVDGEIDVKISGEVNTDIVGVYTLTYTATNTSGNSAVATRTIEISSR